MPRFGSGFLAAAQVAGLSIGSLERHLQSSGKEFGTTWKVVPDAEEFVDDIAALLGLPATMNHAGYWLLDSDLTFTGESGERLFKHVVQVWDSRAKDSGDAVRPICRGSVLVDVVEGIQAFANSADNTEEICRESEALRRKGPDGRRGLEPETFNRFRNYLCGYGVCGRVATGPNAANLRSNFSQDLLFGLANDEYLPRVFERLEFLTPIDRSIVMGDTILPSVVDRFLERLASNKLDVLRIETDTLAERIAAQSDDFRRALAEYKRFYQAVCKLSAMHWQSIVVILIKPFQGLTEEELAKLLVKPTES